jgi:hypothetical protein
MAINVSGKTRFGPNVVRDGLVLYVDTDNTKSWPGSGTVYQDVSPSRISGSISGGNSTTFGSAMTWSNNIEFITINMVFEKTFANSGYADHPINKWNSSYANNASFILYHFGNTGGTTPASDGVLGFYGNNTPENGTGWGSISGSYKVAIGQIVFLTLQYSYLTGGQLWINGAKVEGRYRSGKLGQTTINSTVSDLVIHGPGANGSHQVHLCQIYSRELTDTEVIQSYNAIGPRFGI